MAREAEAGATTPSSELDRWLAAPPIYVDEDEFKSPDYVRRWWKAHATEWPLLAQAARVLIPTSASEVDVERLFSGCRDKFGIRRHPLKAETVRVLTLLRSAYTSEDEVDKELIKSAMELDILPFRNCILWRPDVYDRHINEPSVLGAAVDPLPPPPPSQPTTPTPPTPATPTKESIVVSMNSTPCPTADVMDIS